jgi:hypothetical protein
MRCSDGQFTNDRDLHNGRRFALRIAQRPQWIVHQLIEAFGWSGYGDTESSDLRSVPLARPIGRIRRDRLTTSLSSASGIFVIYSARNEARTHPRPRKARGLRATSREAISPVLSFRQGQ